MSANGVCLSETVYELFFTEGSFAPCCSFAAAREARPPKSKAPAPAAPRARKSRRRRYVESGVISEEGRRGWRGIGLSTSRVPRDRYTVSGAGCIPLGGRRRLPGSLADDWWYRRRRGCSFAARLGLGDAALVPAVPALARLALLLGRKLGAVHVADDSERGSARSVRARL